MFVLDFWITHKSPPASLFRPKLDNCVIIYYSSRVNWKHFCSSSPEPFCGSISNEGPYKYSLLLLLLLRYLPVFVSFCRWIVITKGSTRVQILRGWRSTLKISILVIAPPFYSIVNTCLYKHSYLCYSWEICVISDILPSFSRIEWSFDRIIFCIFTFHIMHAF